jgi:DNA-binding MarR family transcriptional regulator
MPPRKQEHRKTLVADAREVVRVCAAMNIRLAARRITRFLEERMQATGLSVAQFGLMIHIAAAGDDTIGALAERSGLDQSTLSRNLRHLERAGLIEIAVVEKDLRRRAVWLTEAGARRLAASITVWRRAHAAISQVIAPRDARKLADAAGALLGSADKAKLRALNHRGTEPQRVHREES